jgi:transcriptional regulator with XRE-family HTH domain
LEIANVYEGKINEQEWSPSLVRTVRQSIGKTEAEIAAKAGISEELYRDYEAGKIVDLKTDVAINQALRSFGGKHPSEKRL